MWIIQRRENHLCSKRTVARLAVANGQIRLCGSREVVCVRVPFELKWRERAHDSLSRLRVYNYVKGLRTDGNNNEWWVTFLPVRQNSSPTCPRRKYALYKLAAYTCVRFACAKCRRAFINATHFYRCENINISFPPRQPAGFMNPWRQRDNNF